MLIDLATFTVDTTTNELIFSAAHSRYTDSRVQLSTTGTLPAATPTLTPATTYWVTVTSSTRFTLSLTKGGAVIDITGAGTGTHTALIEFDAATLGGDSPVMPGFAPVHVPKALVCGDESLILGGRDDTDGATAPPSLRMNTMGTRRFRWEVGAGARTISMKVKQPAGQTPRPTLTVKANPKIGVPVDVVATAPGGAGWVTVGPVAINPTVDGAVFVEMNANLDGQFFPCGWDDIDRT